VTSDTIRSVQVAGETAPKERRATELQPRTVYYDVEESSYPVNPDSD
jgi:hypothetical protein